MKLPSDEIEEIAKELSRVDMLGRATEDPPVVLAALLRWLDKKAKEALPKPIVCEECVAQGRPSKIVSSYRVGATMDMYYPPEFYIDEDGREHFHDSNYQTERVGYSCANGHQFTVRNTKACWCGWPDRPGSSVLSRG